jgi:dipeptidyl aminopeptidase/acylaminoacyl peptidase
MPARPIELEDLLRFQLAGEPQISPNGDKIVFTVKRIDTEKNKYFTRLWMADTAQREARPFTGDEHGDGNPRWSPDGTQIAFVSDRDKTKAQILLIPPDGGEARPLMSLEEGSITALYWSPDGSKIAFLYRATPEERTEKAKKEREEKGLSSPVRVHTKLFYKLDGFGYFDNSFSQVWVVDVNSGETKQLTSEAHHLGSLAWSPDGKSIAFVSNRRDEDDLIPNHDDIWTVPVEGGALTRIEAPDGPKSDLSWSPDGQWIAFAGHTDPNDTWGGKNTRVLVIPADGSKEARDLTGESDKEVGYATLSDLHDAGGGALIQWSPDSKTLYFPLSEHGDTRLYRVNLDGSGLTPLTPANSEMGAYSISGDGSKFGILLGDATYPAEVWLGSDPSPAGLKLTRLTKLNSFLDEEHLLQMPEAIEVTSADGARIQAWTLHPTGFDPAKKYPAVVYVHGGPAAQYGGQAAPFHELQWLAANGYMILFSNPRGSKGYGEAHTSAIRGDWGNRDWQDIQAVTDYGAALPYVDAGRMAIMGGSYGGYMTAWAVGHTDRFACAITDRLVNNLHSFSGTVDFPWDHGKNWLGNSWDDPSDLWRCSPLAFAGKINTPLLIIHSDGDLRCPISQAEELFASLRMQRKTVEFVRYPGESSHGLSRNGPPDLRLDRLRRNLAWLDKYLKS